MRHTRIIVIIAALLISACSAQPAAQRIAEANQSTSAPAQPTAALSQGESAAPTEDAFLSPSNVPAPSPAPPTTAATATPEAQAATEGQAEPTARLILPPGTAAPTGDSLPQMTLAPTSAPAAQAVPRATAAPAAPRATAAQPAAAKAPRQPVRLVIEDIALDGKLVSVGLDKDRIPVVPEHDVGWYNLSARPGAGENIVLWGHVLRFRATPKIPAPFARLKELKPGAAVVLYDEAGVAHNYTVTQQIWVKPDQVEYILPRGKEMITMVSCIGDKVIAGGEVVDMSNRLITIAEPAA